MLVVFVVLSFRRVVVWSCCRVVGIVEWVVVVVVVVLVWHGTKPYHTIYTIPYHEVYVYTIPYHRAAISYDTFTVLPYTYTSFFVRGERLNHGLS